MVQRRNGWLVLLWVLSALLLGAGAWLVWQTTLASSGTGADVVPVFILPTVFSALAPWVLGAGLAGLVGAVFVHAQRS